MSDKTPPLAGYYCWVGIRDDKKLISSGGKPPKKKSFVTPFQQTREVAAHRSACFHIDPAQRRPLMSEVFDISPISFPDEPTAIAWFRGGAGEAWADEAMNYILLGFSFDAPPDPGRDL